MDFTGIWIPLVTPFRQGRVDLPALRGLAERYVKDGVAGFVVAGSTGEAATMDDGEIDAVLAATIAAAGGKPVLCGLAGARPERVAARAAGLAEAHAVAGFLLAAPAYVKPSQAGIADYFETVASATPLPLVAYDIPGRTGVRIETATLLALADHPNIRAVKDCSGDRAAAEAVVADGRLALLAGTDDELFDQLMRGAVGGVTASAHLATLHFVALAGVIDEGKLGEARWLWRQLAPLTHALFAEPNPQPVKAALADLGWIADELRAPMRPAGAAARAAVQQALAAIEGWKPDA